MRPYEILATILIVLGTVKAEGDSTKIEVFREKISRRIYPVNVT